MLRCSRHLVVGLGGPLVAGLLTFNVGAEDGELGSKQTGGRAETAPVATDRVSHGLDEPETRLMPAPLARGGVQPRRSFLTSEQMFTTRGGMAVDRQDRAAVAAFFDGYYTPNLNVPSGWTNGDIDNCQEGYTSQAYIDATIELVNYFRAMVGLPSVVNQASDNPGAQEAAMMMSRNGALSHDPPMTWHCYTAAGASSAGASNLAIGITGPPTIPFYIYDPGSFNYGVGHRRWILYPPRTAMGTGSVPASSRGSYSAAQALDVFGPTGSRPGTPTSVAWPPEGFVPYQLVYPRWSFALNVSYLSVHYDTATVSMTQNDSAVGVTILDLYPDDPDYYSGDDTIVWEPDLGAFTIGPGMSDTTFEITVSGIGHATSSVTYSVTIFDPATVGDQIFVDGFESGNTSSWS